MISEQDKAWLRRALALARKGLCQVEPNPPVGCVLVRGEDGVVGEGWHAAFGGPHAEVAALQLAGARAQGATAYISLAPCSRTGKTPPCTAALRAAGIRRVVYASQDPLEPADGSGPRELEAAGIEVQGPILAEEGDPLLQRFVRAQGRARPWVVLKWAMGLSGHIAARVGSGGAVSGARAQHWAHELRAHVDAVAIGSETLLVDDPQLNCRLVDGVPDGRPQPLRVVFDRRLRTPLEAKLLRGDPTRAIILTSDAADARRVEQLQSVGARVLRVPACESGLVLEAALGALAALGVRRLLVEGGARVHGAFLRAHLADQISVLVAPRIFGGREAVSAVSDAGIEGMEAALDLEEPTWRRLGEDLLLQGFVPAGATAD